MPLYGILPSTDRIHLQGYNPHNKVLEIVTTANQDPLITHVPIIGVDVWEHAFYLQYLNVKVDVRCTFLHSVFIPRVLNISVFVVPQGYLASHRLG